MTSEHPRADTNDFIGGILTFGVALSSAVLGVGLVLMLLAPPPGIPGTLEGTIAANFGRPTLSLRELTAGVAGGSAVAIL
ncbi:MAG TPA: hypothetical protein VGS04_06890, partial [Nitrososphaerales archaeon]|nr:hypothetical protein [Nitrososphaerales archaeon]